MRINDLQRLVSNSGAPLSGAPQPEGGRHVGEDGPARCRVATAPALASSLARRAVWRQTPKVGAVCLNWARTDLCRGCRATSIPTAIANTRTPINKIFYGTCFFAILYKFLHRVLSKASKVNSPLFVLIARQSLSIVMDDISL